jgi:Fe-S cluster assembly protein SufD
MARDSLKHQQDYQSALAGLELDTYADDPTWVHELRQNAMSRFQSLGFPTARRGNEEWKYTDVGPVAKGGFKYAISTANPNINLDHVENASIGDSGWNQLVFVNGAYSHSLSSVSNLPDGVVAINLVDAIKATPTMIQKHLAQFAGYENEAFVALNTAFTHDGAFIYVPEDTIVEHPIRLLFLSSSSSSDSEVSCQPRILIITGDRSKASVVETYGRTSNDRYFNNAVTEIQVGSGSSLDYCKAQQQSEESFHITTTEVSLGQDSHFSSINIDLGGKLVRNNLNLITAGEGSSCVLNGLYLTNGVQHVDNQIIIDHAQPFTTSRELYKGVLDGKSRSVFHGSIIVREGAVKVNANQVDKNLLLSNEAEADTKPAFWVYCDDVKCGHGAACGQMDDNALFYLRSRGIPESEARGLLVRAFVTEVIDSIPNEVLREQIGHLVQSKLNDWALSS